MGEGVLRAFYPKGQLLGWASGFTWENPIRPSRAAIMEFKVKFEKGFDWTQGGKLPGLCGGGQCVSGCTDLANQQRNFSTRLMWQEQGRMITYPYWPENRSECGGHWEWMDPGDNRKELRLESDVWYTIRQELELGQADQRNSKVRIFLDDRLVMNREDVKLNFLRLLRADGTFQVMRLKNPYPVAN